MAFLFKSKKNQDKVDAKTRDNPANAGLASRDPLRDVGRATGKEASDKAVLKAATLNEKVPDRAAPATSVNNSLQSLGGKPSIEVMHKNSPDFVDAARMGTAPASDLPLRNMSAPTASPPLNPNASLYPWSQRRLTYTSNHPSPFPRYGAAVNSVASKEGDIYMMGGLINSSTVKGDLWMVEAGAGNMACYPLATTSEGPGPRVGHASLLVGNAFIVYGGDTKLTDEDVLDETLYLLNTSTRQWSRAVPAGPRPSGRYGHSLNILASKIYVFGGQVEGYFMNDLVAFDLNQLQVPTNRWEFLIRNSDEGGPAPGLIPPARTNHTIITYNDKLYLFGGTNGFQWFNDVWSYDPLTNEWTQLDCIGYIPAAREGHAAALVDDVMYIFGGRTEDGADLGDLAAFRISSRRWYTFQNMGPTPSPRSGHSMTAYNKQIVVLAGEPSSATREVQDLSIVYVLDTSKIRYPNDQQIQSTPAGERVPGGRRPSGTSKTGMGATRSLNSREGPAQAAVVDTKRLNGASQGLQNPLQQSTAPGPNSNEGSGVAPAAAQAAPAANAGRAVQSAPGPPPQSQAPTAPKLGAIPHMSPPTNFAERAPAVVVQAGHPQESRDAAQASPTRDVNSVKQASTMNGRRSPSEDRMQRVPPPQPVEPPLSDTYENSRPGSRTRQVGQNRSIDSTTESLSKMRASSPPPPTRQLSNGMNRKASNRNSQSLTLLHEIEIARTRNAWLESELEVARKAGYAPSPSNSHGFDSASVETFGEADRPLVEALLAMRSELTNVQGSIDQQAVLAARRIAEVEKQRDAAVHEAVYAKAKLAAHGGSANNTPQLDNDRDFSSRATDRSTDISKKLASTLSSQRELQAQITSLTAELEAEKRGRSLAEDTANAAQSRLAELENYKQSNSSVVGQLKAELHELQREHREQAIAAGQAVAAAKLLEADKSDLEERHRELSTTTKQHSDTFDALRAAIASSHDMKTLLQRKLDDEKSQRELIEEKMLKLRSQHEERTAELETSQRKLKDAEEIAEKYAQEAQTHRQAVMAGLDRVSARTITPPLSGGDRSTALLAQVESSTALVRKYQAAADSAAEKLRGAEERIAGLEVYQEQTSREGLTIRKQLQQAMRETQSLQAANTELKRDLANQQLETNAVNVQHHTLKELLGERGISPSAAGNSRARGLNSPQIRSATPDQSKLRDLEIQLERTQAAHEETKAMHDQQSAQADAAYREKLGQLETDYQSAVHYVKGTEKMLKRMKEELSRYKSENARMKAELEDLTTNKSASSDWEAERAHHQSSIEALQKELAASHATLDVQLGAVRKELEASIRDRDFFQKSHKDAQEHLTAVSTQAHTDLNELQSENALLERRALQAEAKVSSLLNQLETSVDNYRRQSRMALPSLDTHHGPAATAGALAAGGKGHARSISAISTGSLASLGESTYSSPAKERDSLALDSLATELETLRSQWEMNSKTYRLSSASHAGVDYTNAGASGAVISNGVPGTTTSHSAASHERAAAISTPTRTNGNTADESQLRSPMSLLSSSQATPTGSGELSSSLADWRKRLERDEEEARGRKGELGAGSPKGGDGVQKAGMAASTEVGLKSPRLEREEGGMI